MASSPLALKGVIHGNLIQLDRQPDLPDGQEVRVTVEPTEVPNPLRPSSFLSEEARLRWAEALAEVDDLAAGEGLRSAFGAWAGDEEKVDRFLEWNRAQRQQERRAVE